MLIIVCYFQVMGVFGVSILCLHKPFDLINGFVIDDLHCLFLGVTKTLLSLWFDAKYRFYGFHIGPTIIPYYSYIIITIKLGNLEVI